MNKSIQTSFQLLTISVACLLLLPSMVQEGMFMDGLIYSTLAHNLYQGFGEFWNPTFSSTIMSKFHEHPPLAFGLQSWYYSIFGDGFWVDKFYSFTMAVFSGVFIALIWRKVVPKKKYRPYFWFPILLWITIPKASWSYTNNMLENTLAMFSLASIYFLIISLSRDRLKKGLFIALGSAAMACAFLSKGLPSLFPLGFFFFHYLMNYKQFSFGKMVKNTLILLLFSGLIWFSFYSNIEARVSMISYFNSSISETLLSQRITVSRWFIVGVIFKELPIVFILTALLLFIRWRAFPTTWKKSKKTNKLFFFFLLIALSASVPIMISPKQLSFYIVPALPYFALAFAFLTLPYLHYYLQLLENKWRFQSLFFYAIVLTFSFVIGLTISKIGSYKRDQVVIEDVVQLSHFLPPGTTVSISAKHAQDCSLMAYLQRKGDINLDRTGRLRKFVLLRKNEPAPAEYRAIYLPLQQFQLYEKIVLAD